MSVQTLAAIYFCCQHIIYHIDLNALTQKMCNVIIKIHFVVALHISYFLLHPRVTFLCSMKRHLLPLSSHMDTRSGPHKLVCICVKQQYELCQPVAVFWLL